MESVGVVAAAGRGGVAARARMPVKAAKAPRASTKLEAGVDEEKVILAFGINHGFPVRDGKVAWSAMADTLERMRQEALAAG